MYRTVALTLASPVAHVEPWGVRVLSMVDATTIRAANRGAAGGRRGTRRRGAVALKIATELRSAAAATAAVVVGAVGGGSGALVNVTSEVFAWSPDAVDPSAAGGPAGSSLGTVTTGNVQVGGAAAAHGRLAGPLTCTASMFPLDLANKQCYGLHSAAAFDADSCRDACCNDNTCEVFQWCGPNGTGGGVVCGPANSCWIGPMHDCSAPSTGWVSRGRPAPKPTPAPPTPPPVPTPAPPTPPPQPAGVVTVEQTLDLGATVRLWDVDDPTALYVVVSTVVDAATGAALDSVTTRFGPRHVAADADVGLLLNGRHVKLRGMASHMDFAGLGNAVPDRVQRFKLGALRAMGGNAWRCAHNPPNAGFLRAADELGVLVLDENRHFGVQNAAWILPDDGVTGAAFDAENMRDWQGMIRRDRNHPSVFAWSLCNEPECLLKNATISAAAGKLYLGMAAALDPSRNVTGAMSGSWGVGLGSVLPMQGCNYNDGGYDAFHAAHPATPMLATETTNGNEDRGEYGADRSYVSAFDTAQEGWWRDEVARPFMMGGFAWTAFDYKGEAKWPSVNSHFGTLDLAGFPKDRFFWYRARWRNGSSSGGSADAEDTLHVFGNFTGTGAREGVAAAKTTRAMAFTNAAEVELLVLGSGGGANTSLGRHAVSADGDVGWSGFAPLGAGTQLVAHGYRAMGGAAPFVTTALRMPGAAVALQLRWEMAQQTLVTGGQDVALAEVSVVDGAGQLVHGAEHLVSFAVSGPGRLVGVGNGNPHCHEPDKGANRSAFHGLVRAIVQSGDGGAAAGTVTLRATAEGLGAAELSIEAVLPSADARAV